MTALALLVHQQCRAEFKAVGMFAHELLAGGSLLWHMTWLRLSGSAYLA